ncbi:MAG: hypothetical protein P8Y53_09710 [Pseudolabrys sp.]|jgi:hypothetical protein
MNRRRIGVYEPLAHMPWGAVHGVGAGLFGLAVPFVLIILANFFAPAWALALPGAICVLIGGLLMCGSVMLAGNESACRPQDYFRFARG